MITEKNILYSLDHSEIDEIEVFVDISLSTYNFTNVWRKYIANLAFSSVTLTSCVSCA